MKTEIKAALITGLLGVFSSIISLKYGENKGTQNVISEITTEISNISGNNNKITINSISEFIRDYELVKTENEQLRTLNEQYYKQFEDNKNKLEIIDAMSNVIFSDKALVINGEDIVINKSKSMATIDGTEYLSKELAKKLLTNDEEMTIKNETIYIGKIIADKSNLFNENTVENGSRRESVLIDSYGNKYADSKLFKRYGGIDIYSLNKKYSMLRFTHAMANSTALGFTGTITVRADDVVVYQADNLDKTEKPVCVDVPINHCELLTIEYESGNVHTGCIIANAIVYNE